MELPLKALGVQEMSTWGDRDGDTFGLQIPIFISSCSCTYLPISMI